MRLEDLVPRIRELRTRQEQLNSRKFEIENLVSDRRVELADLKTMTAYVDDLHELLREGSLAERRAFIKSFVVDIKVTGKEAVLSYKMPVAPEKVTMTKAGVLPTVQYGGRYSTIGRTFSISFSLKDHLAKFSTRKYQANLIQPQRKYYSINT
jgi:hypothetical protein